MYNHKILFYLAPLINKWLQERHHEHGVYSFKYYIRKELGNNWLEQIHVKCLRLNKQITKHQIIHEIATVTKFYEFLDVRGDSF